MRIYSQKIMLPGAVGQIEALIDSHQTSPLERQQEKNHRYIAVCCHPHPLHLGTMTNKVIHTASRAIASLGIPSIRFNFRGVGKSEGQFAEGIGEQDDLQKVVQWCQKEYPLHRLILCGFSFGAYISALQAGHLQAQVLISIAPPVSRVEFNEFDRPKGDWLVIHGENDELVDPVKVLNWHSQQSNPPDLIMISAASHFFHGKLVELRANIESFIKKSIIEKE